MFGRRQTPQPRKGQRAQARAILMIGTERQDVLAFTVRTVLLKAGLQEAVYDYSRGDFGEVTKEGFQIEAPTWAHGESSIGVVRTPDSYPDRATAQRDVIIITKAFRRVIGVAQAEQLVAVVRRRIFETDADGHYINVTIKVPDDKTLRKLYRALGRR